MKTKNQKKAEAAAGPKTYVIEGKPYTLAPVTSNRLGAYCKLIGIESFDELRKKETIINIHYVGLNIGIDPVKIGQVLSTCLSEDTSSIDCGEIDVQIVDEIFNDFFSQRLRKYALPQL